MNIDIPFWLLIGTLVTFTIMLVDKWFWAPTRHSQGVEKRPFVVEQSYQLMPILLIVLLIRSFIGQAFFVPSPSLMPSVYPGEMLLVDQFSYGVRLPVWNTLIWDRGLPQRGDIAVFKWSVNPSFHLVKRIVGVPGDRISYVNKVLTINGKVAKQTTINPPELPKEVDGNVMQYFEEDLLGVKHRIQVYSGKDSLSFHNLVVPPDHYFFMGDNRDDSDDSRYWGFVARDEIVGKGILILASWDNENTRIRFDRNWTYLTS